MQSKNENDAQEPYQPIDCNYYDVLVLYAMHKEPLKIKVQIDGSAGSEELKGIIKDIYTKDKVEFLKLDTGKVVRLDKLLDITVVK